jgi:hypothetical protein
VIEFDPFLSGFPATKEEFSIQATPLSSLPSSSSP